MTPELSVQSSVSIGVHCHDTNVKGIEIHQLKKKEQTNKQSNKDEGDQRTPTTNFIFRARRYFTLKKKIKKHASPLRLIGFS